MGWSPVTVSHLNGQTSGSGRPRPRVRPRRAMLRRGGRGHLPGPRRAPVGAVRWSRRRLRTRSCWRCWRRRRRRARSTAAVRAQPMNRGACLAGGADTVRGTGHHGARRGRHPEQLGGLHDRDRGRLEQGRVGAEPSRDQPDPAHLVRVQAGQVALDRRRAHVADDADRGRAVQQGPDARRGPGGRGGEDLLLQISASAPGGQAGQAARMNRKSAYGSLAARTACGSGTPWSTSRSRSPPVTAVTDRSQTGPRKCSSRCSQSASAFSKTRKCARPYAPPGTSPGRSGPCGAVRLMS